MMNELKRIELIERGKQLGKGGFIIVKNISILASVGIQKWKGLYKVYIMEIEESKIIQDEDYISDEITKFNTLQEAICYINKKARFKFDELTPRKGQKIFNPNLD